MHKTLLATAVACGLSIGLPFDLAAQAAPSPQDEAQVQTLLAQLQALKASYAQQVRQLRELDMQVQALQAKLAGKAAPAALPAPGGTPPPAQLAQAATPPPDEGTRAGSAAEAEAARQEAPTRSLKDALQQEHALFDRKFTLENSVSYARYDRSQITLNGFLALDAIFLGNIAIEDVKSDSLTYNLAARYGVSPRLTLNLDVPYLYRKTVYQKGGAGGSAAAIAEEDTTGAGLGDIGLSANYKLFDETGSRPDTVLTVGLTAPTGQSPYGIDWKVLQRGDDQYISFAVPEKQPTGNGVWQANLGLSAVKTMDPAIVFANLGYIYSRPRDFGDINTDPETRNPGSVKLGNTYYFGAGVAFAFNERTSLSLSFADKLSAKASLRYKGSPWSKVIGSDAHAATFNMGVTHALSQHTTLVTLLGIGLTPDAPDFSLSFKVPYMF
ncbi:hypothetical protein ACFWZ3_16315 [Frateuria sp. GZRR35]|uniref:hypothetical protein n=1 Tax=Frateuria sp. GZRR35 TaxID=3351536 RepID=UPI003EDBCBAF